MTKGADRELLRHVNVVDLKGDAPESVRVEVETGECAVIAARLGILSVDSLTADLELFRDLTGDVNLVGRIVADVRQVCVVTLDPVAQHVESSIFQRFSGQNDEEEEGEDEDPVEPIVEGEIEVGDVIVQNLALALDPYPRAPGAEFEEVDDEAGKPTGPFAALAALREEPDK